MNPKLIAYDFDGVMTDNKVFIDQKGFESVKVNRADGLAISKIKKCGIKQIIISTEKNLVVSHRAKKLDIECFQNITNKKKALIKYCNIEKIKLEDVIFIGNDINDKEVMEVVGNSFCPNDSHPEIKKISTSVLSLNGGDGVIREFYDLLKKRKKGM